MRPRELTSNHRPAHVDQQCELPLSGLNGGTYAIVAPIAHETGMHANPWAIFVESVSSASPRSVRHKL